jgi:N-ethylmaleimide reductase
MEALSCLTSASFNKNKITMSKQLFSSTTLGQLNLRNRIVMSPMTRSRAINNIPNELMATYYAQRAEAGLIITEGTSPSPNGLGYPRIPGAYSDDQAAGWKKVTDAVHEKGGKIFLQIMHTGRISHPLNLPEGGQVLAPSAVKADEQMYTDSKGMQALPEPKAMSVEEIETVIEEYVKTSQNAIAAGFDGVELHGANGYLIDQFINPTTNKRTDDWGGTAEKRNRFALEVARRVVAAIGADKVGIRLSPYGAFNGMGTWDTLEEDYTQLAKGLSDLGLVYIHIVDHSAMGAPAVADSIKRKIREAFAQTFILSGGYDAERAEADLAAGKGDLVAFGRPFIANPDLVTRMKTGAEIATPEQDTFYTPGEKGYTDYPTLTEVKNA